MTLKVSTIGKAAERVEDLRLLTGRGRYVDDIHLERMVHAYVVRSPIAHGRITRIATEEALRMPGVHAVYTGQSVAKDNGGHIPRIPLRRAPVNELMPYLQYVIALDKVRYVGEPVALIVADTPAQAEDAAEVVHVDIAPLPVVADWRAAAKNESLVFESLGSNVVMTHTALKGDAKAVTGPYVRRERLTVQRHSAVTMETRGVLASWEGPKGKMTVYGAAKFPFSNRKHLSEIMDLPVDCVDCIEDNVGGGFGVRGEFCPEDYLIPYASRKLNRPVKWIEDRRENLMASNHSREVEGDIEIVCERNGRVLALRGTVFVDSGAYVRPSAMVQPRNVAQFLSGPYDISNIHIQSTIHITNKTPSGVYRGPGRFEADFLRERLFDIAARDLGIDPVEFRRINLVKVDQMPYPLATIDNPPAADKLDSGDNCMTLDRCLSEFGWGEKSKLQGRLVDGKYHGLAIGCFIEGGASGPKETCRIEIAEDGGVKVYVGSSNVGQGLLTTMTQIASDALGVPMERIELLCGSTIYLHDGYGSSHSRSTVMGGSAILVTADSLKKNIREAAAAHWKCAPSDVDITSGLTPSVKGKSLSLVELGKLKVQASGEFANHLHTYAYGAAAAHVTVDPGTGRVSLVDFVMVEDIGRIINPAMARGQAIGSAVQGLGGALLEHFVYDENCQLLSGTFADYMLPMTTDFPSLRAIVLDKYPSPNNPLGAKGGGEGGIIPIGGLVANAVSAALTSLGIEVRSLPLTAPRVWHLIKAASAPKASPARAHANTAA